MRHLFVPACACLMTLSGAVTSDRNVMGNHFMDPQKAKPGIVSLTSAEPAVVKLADSESVFVPTNKEPVIGSAMKVSVAVSAKQRPDSVGVKASESIPHASEKAPDTKSNVPEQVANATPDVPKRDRKSVV